MPAVAAGRAGAVRIGLLVAGNTLKRRNAFTTRAADYVGEVRLPVFALLGVVRRRMAVDATRTGQNRIDLLPGNETFFARCRAVLRRGIWECRQWKSRGARAQQYG